MDCVDYTESLTFRGLAQSPFVLQCSRTQVVAGAASTLSHTPLPSWAECTKGDGMSKYGWNKWSWHYLE